MNKEQRTEDNEQRTKNKCPVRNLNIPEVSINMKQRLFSFLIVLCFVSVSGFSLSPEDLVGIQRVLVLRSADEPVTEAQTRNPVPRLLPNHRELQMFVTENMNSLGPNILVESLYLYRKPGGQTGSGWNEAEKTGLFNRLAGISTLAGIEYYSESRKAMRTFYETSQIIDSPSGRNPLPDPVFTETPSSLTLYARQKDLTFGDNIYRFDFYTGPGVIYFMQENLTSMSRGIITAIGRNRLRTVFAVIDAGDSVLLYTAAMARTVSAQGMSERIGASFTNRAKAVIKWFVE